MKKVFVILLIASAFITSSTFAQKGGHKSGIQKQMLIDSLQISSATADSVIAVRMDSKSQIKNVMSDQSLTEDQRKEQIKPIKQEMKARLKQFLTDDQIAKLQQMEREKRQYKVMNKS